MSLRDTERRAVSGETTNEALKRERMRRGLCVFCGKQLDETELCQNDLAEHMTSCCCRRCCYRAILDGGRGIDEHGYCNGCPHSPPQEDGESR